MAPLRGSVPDSSLSFEAESSTASRPTVDVPRPINETRLLHARGHIGSCKVRVHEILLQSARFAKSTFCQSLSFPGTYEFRLGFAEHGKERKSLLRSIKHWTAYRYLVI